MKRNLTVYIYEVHAIPVEVEVDDTLNFYQDALDKAEEMWKNGEHGLDFLEFSHMLPKEQWKVEE